MAAKLAETLHLINVWVTGVFSGGRGVGLLWLIFYFVGRYSVSPPTLRDHRYATDLGRLPALMEQFGLIHLHILLLRNITRCLAVIGPRSRSRMTPPIPINVAMSKHSTNNRLMMQQQVGT